MEDIGLIGLTHILNGGVRIQRNPSLCYARNGDGETYTGPINWRKILKNEYYDTLTNKLKNEYLMIEVDCLILVSTYYQIDIIYQYDFGLD